MIALETHRKQSESEILAASSRLALLADEVCHLEVWSSCEVAN